MYSLKITRNLEEPDFYDIEDYDSHELFVCKDIDFVMYKISKSKNEVLYDKSCYKREHKHG